MCRNGGIKIFYRKPAKIICLQDSIPYINNNNDQNKVRYTNVTFLSIIPEHWIEFLNEDNNWDKISPQRAEIMKKELAEAIRAGTIHDLILSFDPWGEDFFLTVDFENGWAALLYNVLDGYSIAPYHAAYANIEEKAPVQIGGQTPVPKMFALDNFDTVAEIVLHFLNKGQLYHGISWVQSINPSLPWGYE